jgi:drug/metabolite transporter (DMT)-like permease
MPAAVQQAPAPPKAAALSWIALIVVWFVWGSTYLGIRVAVGALPPFLMAGSRYIVAGALLFAILWFVQGARRRRITRHDLREASITGFLLLVVGNGLLCLSEVHLESGTAALLVATTPMWMILIDAALVRSLQVSSVVGILLGTFGVLALFGAPSAHGSLASAILVLIGSAGWAAGSVYARRTASGRPNALLPALEMLAGGMMLTAIGIGRGELAGFHFSHVPASALAGWLWLVVAGAMIAYSAYGYAVRTLPIRVVSTYAYVNPIVAVILGALILKETLTWNVLLGGAAIVLSVVTILMANRNTASAESALQDAA